MCLEPESELLPATTRLCLGQRAGMQQWLLCGCSNSSGSSGCDGVGLQCQRHSPSRVRRPGTEYGVCSGTWLGMSCSSSLSSQLFC